jgi:hypothetical protein
VETAAEGSDGVVNAISLYVEHGRDTFHSVHVEAAARIAKAAKLRSIPSQRRMFCFSLGRELSKYVPRPHAPPRSSSAPLQFSLFLDNCGPCFVSRRMTRQSR